MCLVWQPKFGASLQILKVEIGGDSQAAGNVYCQHRFNPESKQSGKNKRSQ